MTIVQTKRTRNGRLGAAITVAVALLPVVATGRASSAAPPPPPVFTARSCPGHTFPPELEVDCGYVRVPEDRADPASPKIKVGAAIVRSESAHKRSDPIVFLDGGPSFPAISPFAMEAYFAGASFIQDRDVILVDTRGIGTSKPYLGCPELDDAYVDSFYAGSYPHAKAATIIGRALDDCRVRLEGDGVDLAAYNSAESAADLDALRQALGVSRWNLVAISADGGLGLTYMRMFPGGIRSAVLDSAMSTQQLWGLDYDRGLVDLLNSIFAGCEADLDCRAAYPGIRRRFYDLVADLNVHPVMVPIPDFEPAPVNVLVDGAALLADMTYSIYPGDAFDPETIHDVLAMMWATTHGELAETYHDIVGTGPVESDHANEVIAMGKTMSTVCRDLVSFITPRDIQKAIRATPAFARRYLDHYGLGDGWVDPFSPEGCQHWGVGQAAAVQHQPVTSSIPTLVLAGEFDTGVTPNIVREIPETLPSSTYVEFPASAHLQLASYIPASDCARVIAAHFLAHPGTPPDTSCVADIAPFDFGDFPTPRATSDRERSPWPVRGARPRFP